MQNICSCPPDNCSSTVPRAIDGDAVAEQWIFEKFRPWVEGVVRGRLGQQRSKDWDDAVQAIFVRVFAKMGTWKASGPFCHWVMVVASRQAINIAMRNSPRWSEDAERHDIPAPRELKPETVECFQKTISGFREEWVDTLRLRSQGKTIAEIAAAVDRSERTIKTWLSTMYDALLDCTVP